MTAARHPAPYSDAILAVIDTMLPTTGVVVDPFAGVGRIHELATATRRTVGIEIEHEWATQHDSTIHGDAVAVLAAMADGSAAAIATSPTYGNRNADHHNATDTSRRLTYHHTLGRDLTPNNTGAMHWGDAYRALHRAVWTEAVRVLAPGGVFVLNVKNHIRKGAEQRVAEWHIDTLVRGCRLHLGAIDVVPTRGVPFGANATMRTGHELVVAFTKAAA